jgi:hypothetical protein
MLTLRFDSSSELTLGPSPGFALEGPFIRQSPHQEIVCRRTNVGWQLEDEAAANFECRERTKLHFEDWQGRTSPYYGPFDSVRFQNESCFANDQLFAQLAPDRQRWRHLASGIRWHILNLLPASR